jgi:hypothetical protein
VLLRPNASRRFEYRAFQIAIAVLTAVAFIVPCHGSAAVADSSSWRDAVLYFAIVDRFADGDKGNDLQVDDSAKGFFRGGYLVGRGELGA